MSVTNTHKTDTGQVHNTLRRTVEDGLFSLFIVFVCVKVPTVLERIKTKLKYIEHGSQTDEQHINTQAI